MVKIRRKSITMTRGDTLVVDIGVTDKDGNPYVPNDNDEIRFALKKNFTDEVPIIEKIIPNDTLVLRLESEETKRLDQPAQYVYDIQLTIGDDNYVDTFIAGTLTTVEEVW